MTGFFHFYGELAKELKKSERSVSMPYDGLFSFLRYAETDERGHRSACVNAL